MMVDRSTRANNLTKDLRAATAELHTVNPWAGLLRFCILGLIFLSLVFLAWSAESELLFWGWTAIAGPFYAFWLICTHDAVHHTLTGRSWLDELLPRLISWPMLWPFGCYAELHRLHHGWNGVNLRDPERVQWTVQEYRQASPILRWYVRHQWGFDILVLGGLGLIVKTFANALRFQALLPRLRLQLLLDIGGMFLIQGCLLALVISIQGSILRYLLFWLVLERLIGVIGQTRDHLEHYGLWGTAKGHQLTQLYASRNLCVNHLTGWLMGGLNYHAVHHAFPDIPFNRLPEAHQRIQAVLQNHGLPLMTLGQGYLREAIRLSRQATLIGEVNAENPTGRN